MPDWLARITIADIAGVAVAVTAFALFLHKIGKPLAKVAQWAHDFLEDWRGKPEERDASGRLVEPARPGVLARLESIEHEVTPNHGTSAHDKITGKVDHLTALVSEALSEIGDSRREARERDEAHSGRLYRVEQLTARLAEELARDPRDPEGE